MNSKIIKTLIAVISITVVTILVGCEKQTEDRSPISKNNFNSEGLPIVHEPITLTVAVRKRGAIKKPFEELEVFQMINRATNIDIEWLETPLASWRDKKNLIISSGNWPDIFYGNFIFQDEDVTRYAADGVIIPLDDLIDKYAPNIKKVFEEYPEFKDYITAPDGHIYSLPVIDANFPSALSAQFINKEWLDEVGMDIPTTTDEFYRVLKAFKERLEPGETPFTFMFENNIQGINGMFGSFGLTDNTNKLTVRDGRVIYTAVQEEYKNALLYFHKLFREGLIDLESFSQQPGVFKSKVINKKTGVFNAWSLSWAFGKSYRESGYVFMPPLKGPNGDRSYFWKSSSVMSGRGSFMITSTCEYPEAAIRWADYQVTPEVSFQLAQGKLGVTYELKDDGLYHALPSPDGVSHNDFRHSTTAGANSFNMVTESFLLNVVPSSAIVEKKYYETIYKESAGNEPIPPMFLELEAAQRFSELNSIIGPYQREKTVEWLIHGGIEKGWDDYISQLDSMGLKDMVDIIQQRYDEVYK